MNENFLQQRLDKRKALGLLRSLKVSNGLIDFCSNDYLGFASSGELLSMIEHFPVPPQQTRLGSKGSRLLAGNTAFVEELEKYIADFHGAEAGLIFNSGYDANVGFFSSVPKKNDVVLYDELIHASVHDGMRMGKAETISFSHNVVNDLKSKLEALRASKEKEVHIFVAVESVYSMDGDLASLDEMSKLCEQYQAMLIVDEAHATGVVGKHGKGLVNELGLEKKVFARLHTFGKALGTHGAVVLGSETLRNYLINFARSFIYSTALPYPALVSVRCAYDFLPKADQQRMMLQSLIALFKDEIKKGNAIEVIESNSPIQSVIIPGNENVRSVAAFLQSAGFDVRPIVSPTVPRGRERLRICIHAFNTEEEVRRLVKELPNCQTA
ncbi:MAG TPA: 8-amino-7-oxononanoate synthase [Chitinophagales bacterium]|nr:8-amino-7-oxononanoate synthase [Chitinophagales bacterium]